MGGIWIKFRIFCSCIRFSARFNFNLCRCCAYVFFVILKFLLGFLLLLNFCMYVTVAAFAGRALNKAIDHPYVTGKEEAGFMVIFALIAGAMGTASCLSGLHDIRVWTAESLEACATSAVTAWALTLLAMGVACKEIHMRGRSPKLIRLESVIIVLCGTELLFMMVLYPLFLLGDRLLSVATTTDRPQKESMAAA